MAGCLNHSAMILFVMQHRQQADRARHRLEALALKLGDQAFGVEATPACMIALLAARPCPRASHPAGAPPHARGHRVSGRDYGVSAAH
jgi:hypothetical protein